jgi:hypothetical protein
MNHAHPLKPLRAGVDHTAVLPGAQTSTLYDPRSPSAMRSHIAPTVSSSIEHVAVRRRSHVPYTVVALLLVIGALAYFFVSHMAAESIVGLGVATSLAALVLFIGLRPFGRNRG